jgi:hypothetical protein
MNAGV